MNDTRLFPVLFSISCREELRALDCPKFIRWDALSDGWAYQNHSQTLERLAQRGGLDPTELVANLERREWKNMSLAAAVAIIKKHAP